MTLQDIYDQLAYGELKQIFKGKIDNPTIQKEKFPEYFPTIQLALTELHKRFRLREGNFPVDITEVPGKTSYVLTLDYAESNTKSKEPVKYIKDASAPFQDNLMKIEHIFGVLNGAVYEIPLNVAGDTNSIKTSSFNTLMVPTDPTLAPWLVETAQLDVVYRADHPQIKDYLANNSPLSTTIYLPGTHLEALLYYVAMRITTPVGMQNEFHAGNNYSAKFEASCLVLSGENMEIDTDAVNEKLDDRGWP